MIWQKKRTNLTGITWLLLMFVCFFPSTSRAAALGDSIRMTVGQQRVLDVPAPLEQVAIGDPAIADVKIVSKGKQLLITALGQGTTDILTWDMNGRQKSTLIHVVMKDIRIIRSEITGILQNLEGVVVRAVGDRVVIDGEIFTKQDFERIKKVESIYSGEVVVLARMSPSITRLIAAEVNRSLKKNGFPDVQAEAIGDKIFLEGTVQAKKELGAVDDLCKAYFDNFVNLVKAGGKTDDMVLVDIHFVEIGTRFLEKIGLTWDDVARFQLAELNFFTDLLTKAKGSTLQLEHINSFGVAMELLESNAMARSLAHPRLLCKSGEEAQFHAGGEIATPIVLADKIIISYKNYGIIIGVSPVAHRNDRISIKIEAENSTLDFTTTVLDIPGFKKRKVETFVTMEENQVLILSGLVNHDDAKDMDNVPGIGKLPILGELFKSRSFSKDETELVIFVSARRLNSTEAFHEDLIRDTEKKYQEKGKQMEPDLFD